MGCLHFLLIFFGRHVAFKINGGEDTLVQRTGIESGFYKDLSLSHRINNPPEAVEVSICHRGRRPGTAISRMSVEDYKRQSLAQGKYIPDNPAEMSAPAPANAAPAAVPMDTSQQSSSSSSAAPAQAAPAPDAAAAAPAAEPAMDYMSVFRKAADQLNEDEKKVFIQGQLDKLRELEDAHKKIKDGENQNAMLQETHKKQIKQTMDTIRNFFLQGADQERTEQVNGLERIMNEHPEAHSAIGQLVECAHRRIITAEAKNATLVEHVEKSKPEQELYARMRALQRDSTQTHNYHFEPQAGMVSENANSARPAAEAPSKKRARVDPTAEGLKAIEAALGRTLPARPGNIRMNEEYRSY